MTADSLARLESAAVALSPFAPRKDVRSRSERRHFQTMNARPRGSASFLSFPMHEHRKNVPRQLRDLNLCGAIAYLRIPPYARMHDMHFMHLKPHPAASRAPLNLAQPLPHSAPRSCHFDRFGYPLNKCCKSRAGCHCWLSQQCPLGELVFTDVSWQSKRWFSLGRGEEVRWQGGQLRQLGIVGKVRVPAGARPFPVQHALAKPSSPSDNGLE